MSTLALSRAWFIVLSVRTYDSFRNDRLASLAPSPHLGRARADSLVHYLIILFSVHMLLLVVVRSTIITVWLQAGHEVVVVMIPWRITF